MRFDDLNRLYDQTGVIDDGRTWHTEWDVDNTAIWSRQITYQDVADTQAWSEHSLRFDASNRLYDQTGAVDDGRTWHTEWDVGNTEFWSRQVAYQDVTNNQSWSQHTQRFDDLNRLYEQTGIIDDGRTWHTQWDVDNTENWSRQVTYQDDNDAHAWSQNLQLFDDLNRLYNQTGITDAGSTWNTLWDWDNTEVWHRQMRVIDAVDNYAWSEQIYEYDAFGALINHVTVDDPIL